MATQKPPAPDRPAVGDAVEVVTARGEHVPAEVIAVRSRGLVDLRLVYLDEEITITSSPYDPGGTMPDSWHRPVPGIVSPDPAAALTPAK